MIKPVKFILLILMLVICSSNDQLPVKKMESFKWMLGSWKMETLRGTTIEFWNQVNDTLLEGHSIRVGANGDSVLLEKIKLVLREDHYCYIPTALGQNNNLPVVFRITSFTNTSFISENMEHDFPKRISYTLLGQDSLHAFIDDGEVKSKRNKIRFNDGATISRIECCFKRHSVYRPICDSGTMQ